jgi:hypothetical protein
MGQELSAATLRSHYLADNYRRTMTIELSLSKGTPHQSGQCGQIRPIVGHIDQPEQPRYFFSVGGIAALLSREML